MPDFFSGLGKPAPIKVMRLRAFAGVRQDIDEDDLDFKFSKTAINCDTSGGMLKPLPGYAAHAEFGAAPANIRSLIPFYSSATGTSYYLAATDNDIYLRSNIAPYGWTSIIGTETISNGYFKFVNYQDGVTDIVAFTNGVDDVFKWTGTGNISKLTPTGTAAPKGADITLNYERLWITALPGAQGNAAYWSDAQNPTNWTVALDDAGTITNPTWDGDRIVGIATLFDSVVVFKRNSAFRVRGTYPGEYRKSDVLTTAGLVSRRSLCSGNSAAFYMSDDGLMVYDGMRCQQLGGKALRDVMARRNRTYDTNTCGVVYKDRLYMAITTGVSTVNNEVIEYDLITGMFMLRTGIRVDCWLKEPNQLLFVNQTQVYTYNSGATYAGGNIAMQWDTPISTLGNISTVKRIKRVRITGKGGAVTLTITADSSTKVKTITLPDSTGSIRTTIAAKGRRIGVSIANVAGNTPEINAMEIEYAEAVK